jgi:hypothetical protein
MRMRVIRPSALRPATESIRSRSPLISYKNLGVPLRRHPVLSYGRMGGCDFPAFFPGKAGIIIPSREKHSINPPQR